MSSDQQYFCHQCERSVQLAVSPSSEIACPICAGGFLEEIETPPTDTNPSLFFPFPETFPPFFQLPRRSTPDSDLNAVELVAAFARFAPPRSSFTIALGPGDGDPLNRTVQFVQSRLQDLIAGGANIQVVVENQPGGDFQFSRGPMVVGDYLFGSGLEQLIQQLAENDPNRYGTPPASKSAVEALPMIKITEDLLKSDETQCAVCKDTFEIGEEAMEVPCKHLYHKDCLLPWLELHNSCPVCRFELPTDDVEYEQRSRDGQAPVVRSVGESGGESGIPDAGFEISGQENSQAARTGERIMRISLPWTIRSLFGALNSTNNGESSNDVDANSTDRGGRGSADEPRPEDLD